MDTIMLIDEVCVVRRNKALLRTIGTNVKRFRDAKKISQERLAELADCHRNYVARIELGQIDLSVSGLIQLARGLQVDPMELLKK